MAPESLQQNGILHPMHLIVRTEATWIHTALTIGIEIWSHLCQPDFLFIPGDSWPEIKAVN